MAVAFPWLHLAFGGHLEAGEVLVLWDRLLGYDGCDLLPVLAVGVFLWRRESLMKAKGKEDVEDLLGKTTMARLKVVPILQGMLFGEVFVGERSIYAVLPNISRL